MKPLTRRSLTAGLGAAVAAIPALALPVAPRGETSTDRVKRLTSELEEAVREIHGVSTITLGWNIDGTETTGSGLRPYIVIVAET